MQFNIWSIVGKNQLRWFLTITIALKFLLIISPVQSEQLKIACSATERLCSWLNQDQNALRGVDVNVLSISASDVQQTLQISPIDSGFDIWWGAPSDMLLSAANDGLLRPFQPANIHHQLRWSRQLWDASEGQAVGIFAGTLGIISNPIALAPFNLPAPRCWSDLGDIQYRGHLLLEQFATSGNMFTFLSTLHHLFNTAQAQHLSQQIKLNANYKNDIDSLRAVATGDRGITVALVHEAKLLYSFYSPLVVSMPCEGSNFVMGGASIIKTTKNPDLASAFIEYTLSNEFQNEVINTVSTQMFSNINTAQSEVYQNYQYLNVINYDVSSYFANPYREQILQLWK